MATLKKQKGLGILTKIVTLPDGRRFHLLHFDNGKTLYKRLSVKMRWKVLFYQKEKVTASHIRTITPEELKQKLWGIS